MSTTGRSLSDGFATSETIAPAAEAGTTDPTQMCIEEGCFRVVENRPLQRLNNGIWVDEFAFSPSRLLAFSNDDYKRMDAARSPGAAPAKAG